MKRILSMVIISIFVMISVVPYNANAEEVKSVFSKSSVTKVTVNASSLNVRCGPGKAYPAVKMVYRGQVLNVFGEAWGWYAVELSDYTIGYVSSAYVLVGAVTIPAPSPSPAPAPTPYPSPSTQISSEMQEMLNLINAERAKAGSPALKFDSVVNKVALLKAQDMVSKNYFSHTSPTYGSPFDMLKQFGVSFKSAGENLAGNTTVQAAHTALMNSPGHRQNILNPSYNYIGIGIQSGSQYGKIFVQMFIQR